MNRCLTYLISAEYEKMPVEDFLRRSKGFSHRLMTHVKRTPGGILLNGRPVYSNTVLSAGDMLEIYAEESAPSLQIIPVKLPLHIIYEDEDLLVINKGADTPIHPSINNHENTLANAVMYYFQQQNLPFTYRCINRLDRDTSGLLIIAKNMISGTILHQMSANHQLHRTYQAIVEGEISSRGTIDAPIARAEDSALMRCVDYEKGETAVTHYTPITTWQKSGRSYSLLKIALETGRTHQIRVHMKHIGHPLIGDFLYNPSSRDEISRQALHSYGLSFHHPITNEALHFTAPLPEDMFQLIPNIVPNFHVCSADTTTI